MRFVAEYGVEWEGLESAVAKRLEWEEVQPEGFRIVSEYVWHAGDPPFRGVAVLEAERVEDLHEFVLHYGPTIQLEVHPATDVMGAVARMQERM